ncbi:MAG: hypothetical protein ABMA64_09915 [Myxococcota bacterium]
MLLTLLALLPVAGAAELDLTSTSSTGCGTEWYGGCLPNDVWGSTDVFGVATPASIPVLSIGASATATSMIELGGDVILPYDTLTFEVAGRALSASTTVSIQTRFFNSTGAVLATHTDVVHSGHAGLFNVHEIKTNIPLSAASWNSRLVIEDDAVVISSASTGCFWSGPEGCNDPNEPPTGDNGGHGCSDCSLDCAGPPPFTATGQDCEDTDCSASCGDDTGEDFQFQPGVTQTP